VLAAHDQRRYLRGVTDGTRRMSGERLLLLCPRRGHVDLRVLSATKLVRQPAAQSSRSWHSTLTALGCRSLRMSWPQVVPALTEGRHLVADIPSGSPVDTDDGHGIPMDTKLGGASRAAARDGHEVGLRSASGGPPMDTAVDTNPLGLAGFGRIWGTKPDSALITRRS
jgi:hypothetical protein